MNGLNLKSKQRGVFSIEFAIVGVVFSLLLAFSGDVIMKISIKGKLDRLSYSLVNVLKEEHNCTVQIINSQQVKLPH